MPTTLWRLKVAPEKQEQFERLTSQLVRDVATNEPGNVFEYRRGVEDPLTYVLFLSFDTWTRSSATDRCDYPTGAGGQIMEAAEAAIRGRASNVLDGRAALAAAMCPEAAPRRRSWRGVVVGRRTRPWGSPAA